ncbi:hypothetical protein Forpi1262_v018260 [Fusarium oxysporum f. sp. raphani]|uniref:CCHC-type domain-containing protein n=1 Tax=Fusarium oxysporum f. sp. raphani TaxID=96318 RepID=A0A8J5NKV7_FUSOX|nr:hypothetical protein Forpi1262_v018260 [Fusarium oxysporum f. sp. raphani]
MASSSTIPPVAPDPFNLGIHTPANLNRGARAALLQNSPATVSSTIGVSPVPERMAQTPSSPLIAATAATATEGAAHASPSSIFVVFQAFCAKFEEAAQQFTSEPHRRFAQHFADSFLDSWKRELSSAGPATPKPTYSSAAATAPSTGHDHLRVFVRLEAEAPARDHSSYAIRTLIREKLGPVSDKIRQVFQVRSGWAVLAADLTTRDFLVQKQADWAAELGPTAVETNKEWFTYVVSDFPVKLTDFHGNEVDSDSIVSDKIEIQTGFRPVDIRPARQVSDNPLTKALLVSFLKPTKRFWSLFGSSAARLVDKTDRPRQCETCWGYHFARNCHRRPVCRRCGKAGHSTDDCAAPEQCINCLGPHQANFRKCPARPKIVHGVLRRLTKEQRQHIRTIGAETYRQRHRKPQTESHQEALQGTSERQSQDFASQEQPSVRAPSPAVSGAPSCIMVATTPIPTMKQRKNPNSLGRAQRESVESVMTYVRRDPRLLADQIRPFQTRDILWLTINNVTIVNFYRQNDERDALDTLLQWPVPDRCLVAADFNARHRSWQSGQTTNRGQEIAGWALENDLDLLNTLDIPTNPLGNTIDLAFTNMPLAEATVEDHLVTSSDHFTLSLALPNITPAPLQLGKIRVTTEDELKRFIEVVELGAAGLPTADSTTRARRARVCTRKSTDISNQGCWPACAERWTASPLVDRGMHRRRGCIPGHQTTLPSRIQPGCSNRKERLSSCGPSC